MGIRVFLTGVSGHLGSVLAAHLARMPDIDCITGLYHSTTPKLATSPKLNFIQMDIRSPDLAWAMTGYEIVIHSAFVVMWKAGMPAEKRDDINFNGIRNIAQAAARNRVKRFIYASSIAAYNWKLLHGKEGVDEESALGDGNSGSYYPDSKAKAERLLTGILDLSGIPLTIMRPCTITGPNDRYEIKNLRNYAWNTLGRDPRIQFVHEDDVASAFIQAICNEMDGAYNVVSDDFLRTRALNRLLGVKFVPTLPVWLARLVTDVRWRYLGSDVHPSWVDNYLADVAFSNAKLKSTGWRPQYTSEATVLSAL